MLLGDGMGVYSRIVSLIFGVGIFLFGAVLFPSVSDKGVIVTKQPIWEMNLNDIGNSYNGGYSKRERVWFCVSAPKRDSSPTTCVLSNYGEKECTPLENKGSLWVWVNGLIFKSNRSLYCGNQSVLGIFFVERKTYP